MASDRIVLDVGGTKFITAVSTLTSNSTYFASLLSGNWKERIDNNQDNNGIFLDQDPIAFEKLLAYMRRGTIQVIDVDVNVLSLSVFLGIEKLLIAIKVRWYNNIGRGEVLNKDEEISMKFDEVYGGISKAISTGLYPYFLKADDNAEKETVLLTMSHPDLLWVQIEELSKVPKPEKISFNTDNGEEYSDYLGGLVGALNWLYSNGYTKYEEQFTISNQWDDKFSFSRRKHTISSTSIANDVLIPSEDELTSLQLNTTKQFAMIVEDCENSRELVIAPAEYHEDPVVRNDPTKFAIIYFQTNGGWLERHGFLTREESYEQVFQEGHINQGILANVFVSEYDPRHTQCRLYSRVVPK